MRLTESPFTPDFESQFTLLQNDPSMPDASSSPSTRPAQRRSRGRHAAPRAPKRAVRSTAAFLALPCVAAGAVIGVRAAQRPDFLEQVSGHPQALAAMVNTTGLGAIDGAVPAEATRLMAAGAGSVTGRDAASADRVSRGAARQALAAGSSSDSVARPASAADQGTDAIGGADDVLAQTIAQAEAKIAADALAAKIAADKAKAAATVAAAHRWVKPLNDYNLSSGFGMRHGKMHPAIDLAGPQGTPVVAMSSGTVISAGWSDLGYGNLVEIQYWDGTVSWYAHNVSLAVKVGDTVKPGQVVSHRGTTGHSTGPHVHLEIHPGGGDAVSPLPWLAAHGISM